MIFQSNVAARLAGLSACLAVLSCPVWASTITFDGPVYPLAKGCVFLPSIIPDTIPRTRPVYLTSPPSGFNAAVSTYPYAGPRARSVSYAYSFSGLDDRLPGQWQGIFIIQSTRATVYASAWWDPAAMVSDRIYTNSTKAGPTAFSWSGVASEGPLALGATFSDTWSLTLKMTGLQQAYAGATLKPAQLDVSCTALVKPAPPPILFP